MTDPLKLFHEWVDGDQMAIATATPDGRPSVRMLLLKSADERGFIFFTGYTSRKGRELEANPRATILFPWLPLERQVIAEGPVTRVAREESESYFHSRPLASQLGAWASQQSTLISGRSVLEEAMKALEKKYAGREVPLPPHWGGYRLAPEFVEFWQGRRNRLHDRLRYRRDPAGDWMIERLAP